jgi:hypothetical protein
LLLQFDALVSQMGPEQMSGQPQMPPGTAWPFKEAQAWPMGLMVSRNSCLQNPVMGTARSTQTSHATDGIAQNRGLRQVGKGLDLPPAIRYAFEVPVETPKN